MAISKRHKLPATKYLVLLWLSVCFLVQTYLIWSVPEAELNAPHNVAERKAVITAMFLGIALSMSGASSMERRKFSPAE